MDSGDWLLFASIAFIATISPGPAILLVSSHSFAYGLKRSTATMLGNITGLFVMSALSVAGLSAIILHSTTVFTLIKLIGAAYLVYLGIKLISNGFAPRPFNSTAGRAYVEAPSFRGLFVHGLVVALSNPKAIAFTTALFPQFIDNSLPILPQFSILIATFMSLSFACLFGYAYLSAGAQRTAGRIGMSSLFSKLFGVIFIISGGLLAGTTQKQI
ncbi:MAG: LysE family translocator [Candidatus Sedimenticola sp. PURPLELP]